MFKITRFQQSLRISSLNLPEDKAIYPTVRTTLKLLEGSADVSKRLVIVAPKERLKFRIFPFL